MGKKKKEKKSQKQKTYKKLKAKEMSSSNLLEFQSTQSLNIGSHRSPAKHHQQRRAVVDAKLCFLIHLSIDAKL